METQREAAERAMPEPEHLRAHRLGARVAGRPTARRAVIEAARRKLAAGLLETPEVLDEVAGQLERRLRTR